MEGAGYPFISNPFTGPFYPLNIFLVAYQWIVGAFTQYEYQAFTILGVSIFALGLYYWLLSLNIRPWAAVFSSVLISLSWRISDFIRLPNAIHTIAWIPWILYAINLFFSGKRKKAFIVGLAGQIMLMTAGYPYIMFYTYLFIPLYLFFLFFTKKSWGIEFKDGIKKTLAFFASFFAVPILIISPYFYLVARTISQTADRPGSDFAFSTHHTFGPMETIASFIFPPSASSEGFLYFGVLPLALIAFYFLYERKEDSQKLKLISTSVILMVSFISYGALSYIFSLFWFFVPLVSSLRVWARFSTILLPIIAVVLAKSVEFFYDHIREDRSDKNIQTNPDEAKKMNLNYLWVFFGSVLAIQGLLMLYRVYDATWVADLRKSYFHEYDFLAYTIISFFIFVLVLQSKKITDIGWKRGIMVGLLVVSLMDVGNFGRLLWGKEIGSKPKNLAKALEAYTKKTDLRGILMDSFANKRSSNPGLSPYFDFNTGVFSNVYYGRYVDFIRGNPKEDVDRLLGVVDGKKLYYSGKINYASVADFLKDAESEEQSMKIRADIMEYTGDKLSLRVISEADGYVHFIDNWDSDWVGQVNGKKEKIEQLFGTFKSLPIQKGENAVIFEYKPLKI
jgi:hypothetical protein